MIRNKILVIQTAFLGDAILTLPLIQKIAELNPDSIIDVISIPSTSQIFLSSPYVNKVIELDKKGKHKSLFSILKFSKNIKKGNYDQIISPHRSFRTSLIVWLSGIKNSVGFNNAALNFLYKRKVNYRRDVHEVQRNFDLLELGSGIKNWKVLPQVKIQLDSVKKVDDYLRRFNNNKVVAIAPGSVWETKIYPEEHFIVIIDYLLSQNYCVVIIGGEEDFELSKKIESKYSGGVFSTVGLFSIIESIELLKSCELLICNDSGPTHMAMCSDTPVITIYCSTVPSFGFAPYNKKSTYVSYGELDCKPCGIHGRKKCPIETFDCGWKLKPSSVMEKIKEIIT